MQAASTASTAGVSADAFASPASVLAVLSGKLVTAEAAAIATALGTSFFTPASISRGLSAVGRQSPMIMRYDAQLPNRYRIITPAVMVAATLPSASCTRCSYVRALYSRPQATIITSVLPSRQAAAAHSSAPPTTPRQLTAHGSPSTPAPTAQFASVHTAPMGDAEVASAPPVVVIISCCTSPPSSSCWFPTASRGVVSVTAASAFVVCPGSRTASCSGCACGRSPSSPIGRCKLRSLLPLPLFVLDEAAGMDPRTGGRAEHTPAQHEGEVRNEEADVFL